MPVGSGRHGEHLHAVASEGAGSRASLMGALVGAALPASLPASLPAAPRLRFEPAPPTDSALGLAPPLRATMGRFGTAEEMRGLSCSFDGATCLRSTSLLSSDIWKSAAFCVRV